MGESCEDGGGDGMVDWGIEFEMQRGLRQASGRVISLASDHMMPRICQVERRHHHNSQQFSSHFLEKNSMNLFPECFLNVLLFYQYILLLPSPKASKISISRC